MLFSYRDLLHQDIHPASVLSTKPAHSPVSLLMTVQGDLPWPSGHAGVNRLAQEGHCRSHCALGVELRCDGFPPAHDRGVADVHAPLVAILDVRKPVPLSFWAPAEPPF